MFFVHQKIKSFSETVIYRNRPCKTIEILALAVRKCMNNSGFNQLDHNCLPNNDSITQNSGCLIIIPIWNVTYSVWEALQKIKKVIYPFPQNTLHGNLCKKIQYFWIVTHWSLREISGTESGMQEVITLLYPAMAGLHLEPWIPSGYNFLLGSKVMTNLDSILKSRDITLPTKVHLVKAMVFPVVMYGCES